MARINLLPWRAERRRERKIIFLSIMGTAVLASSAAVFATSFYYDECIAYQNARNTFLDQQINVLDKKIDEIRSLEDEKERLVKRIAAIQTLETNRPLEVRLFDEVVNTLPDGVFLTGIEQKGQQLTMHGIAQSQSRVSSYMRNIEASRWVSNPKLEVVQTTTKEGDRVSDFTLHLDQVLPKQASADKAVKVPARKPAK